MRLGSGRRLATKQRGILQSALWLLLSLVILGAVAVLSINATVIWTADEHILTEEAAAKLEDVDCILVLGCRVYSDGEPSAMLHDRLKRGVALYEAGAAGKLLMSGDHGRADYDEVDAMKQFAVDCGISPEDVFMDHAGFSTYESMYRARDIFQAKKIIIVSQEYHLYRAVYIARQLGLEAYGVSADYRSYTGQHTRQIREVLARVKDFATSVFQPKPTYLGDVIPISGNGNLTNDENSDFV